MKTAVSIPDEVYKGAERLARQTRKSRGLVSIDKALLTERVGKLPPFKV